MRQVIQAGQGTQVLRPELQEKIRGGGFVLKYHVIVIDPPWDLKVSKNTISNTRYKPKLPYGTMTEKELLEFPLCDFAAEDCLLFLWTVYSKTRFAFDLVERWGFKFYAMLTWYKHDGVCRNGIYNSTEPCLIAYRGKLRASTNNKHPIRLFVDEAGRQHSRKPDKFYRMLAKSTLEPRIDIFARRKHYGFDAWGDQVQETSQEVLT